MQHIAIFASGKGSNAQAIIEYFNNHPTIKVALVVTNNPDAGVIKIAHQHKIISAIVGKNFMGNEENMNKLLGALNIDLLVLAGYLQLIPGFLIKKFENRIINIHPALLPKHGGKGMYGKKVHEAVLQARDAETGITIHYVNEKYDEGEAILQKSVSIDSTDNAEAVAAKVLQLEHEWYPKTIEKLLTKS
ncbi:MAG TPA: phosphoribosylglycinamide formyltransferase [Chitinophagales bacterium]|nr:phosphoribosylglycinamide formyltransferase [Chitinophagales bacterium]